MPGWGSSVGVWIPPRCSPRKVRGRITIPLFLPAAEQWKPLNPEEKKRYDREFLLGFQFIFASMQKPEGLPQITDVVLDKVGAVLGRGVGGSGSSAPRRGKAGLGKDLHPQQASCVSRARGRCGEHRWGLFFQFLVPALRLGDGSIPLLCPRASSALCTFAGQQDPVAGA